ncbi:Pleckstrin homology domain-containing protein [Auriculariales sp. MPI-PUGE-AT-0066]|nr:Pleckstrin homology domain-containing protein [Auriculariales sp. MPI-PUGE-AT-0066]
MPPAPTPVVSHKDEEQDCPVCLEPLSFSFRLPGEKPHVVPDCGHALHEACFTAVYGPLPGQRTGGGGPARKPSSLGVCGVCRRPMKVGGDGEAKSNKIAALTGMGERATGPGLYPGRDGANGAARAHGGGHSTRSPAPVDPNEDDALEQSRPGGDVVAPAIQVRAEFPTLHRTHDPTQPLTCIVVVELPARRQPPPQSQQIHDPPPYRAPSVMRSTQQQQQQQGGSPHGGASPVPSPLHRQPSGSSLGQRAASPHDSMMSGGPSIYNASAPNTTNNNANNAAFAAITEDLRARIIDWKGHPLSGPNGMGPLQLFDILSLRRESQVREFYVYLFREAIICVLEERKRSLGRLLSAGSGTSAFTDNGSIASGVTAAPGKGVLRLKGRIYIRHIRRVSDTSAASELSLTIDMEDERLDSFILIFKNRASLENWRVTITQLVAHFQQSQGQRSVSLMDMDNDFGTQSQNGSIRREPTLPQGYAPNSKAARLLNGGGSSTDGGSSTQDSLMGSGRSTSISSAATTSGPPGFHGGMGGAIPEETGAELETHHIHGHGYAHSAHSQGRSEYGSTSTPVPVPVGGRGGDAGAQEPLPHAPLDLILVLSLPPSRSGSGDLKLRVIRSSLDFVVANMGRRDRLSLVTFEVGAGAAGRVRKTPFLVAGRAQGRARLQRFIDSMGEEIVEGHNHGPNRDEFAVRGSKDEKTDVVTAVNHGLDVVLQRKSKNPVSGMILVSDAADSTRRAQMDLVLARAEAGNLPIHSFGYGRAHDPASLWLMSNHTNGTYTFVKDWYDLRDCLAGCIGGMMSIGLTNMKLHMKIVDGQRFRIRKVSGAPNAILSSDGRDVDVELGELRFGERKEMLVELELDNREGMRGGNGMVAGGRGGAMSATDEFNARMGLDGLSLGDSPANLMDGMMDGMIDEVPVFEVDGGFFDPGAAKTVARLAHPVLLTVTLVPPAPGAAGAKAAAAAGSDPVIVRRRMELLASDMITRALVLVSKKNYPQAQRIMAETKRILHTVLSSITATLPPPGSSGTRSRREVLAFASVRTLQSVLADIAVLAEALEENLDMFAHDQRNFGAQQAMILRDQKAWTGRTPTEKLFWTTDNSIELVTRSTDWVSRD